MEFLRNEIQCSPTPFYVGKDIIIAIDSSKTNSCMFVADKYGNVIDDYELRGDPKDYILDQCFAQRKFMALIFRGANVLFGGIEDIITKKEDDDHSVSRGMIEHESRFKITTVFNSFISYFQDNHNITLELVNNWAWKSGTLPEKYRTRDHKKGSLDYHKAMRTKYANRKDDVTDAYQILQHLKITHNIIDAIAIEGPKELTSKKHTIWIFSGSADVAGTTQFLYNEGYAMRDIVPFMTNRLRENEVGYCRMNTNLFTPNDIYKNCSGAFEQKEEEILLVVKRNE